MFVVAGMVGTESIRIGGTGGVRCTNVVATGDVDCSVTVTMLSFGRLLRSINGDVC